MEGELAFIISNKWSVSNAYHLISDMLFDRLSMYIHQ